jgi:hypothetical protein
MPVTLIVFGDKSHTDLHGDLALTPVIFKLTLFDRSARNNTNFWRPIAYIPNLSYGKGTADKTETQHKMQDEHTCLSCAFQSLQKKSEEGRFDLVVLGEQVRVRVWIHFFIFYFFLIQNNVFRVKPMAIGQILHKHAANHFPQCTHVPCQPRVQ